MTIHCRFCKGPVFPWNQREGMHPRCFRAVEQMYRDERWRYDAAYRMKQAQMRWKEEDEL